MHFSDRFLHLVQQQLISFEKEAEIEHLVIYVTKNDDGNSPTFEVLGQKEGNAAKIFAPIENDPDLRAPSPNRRWYPLQDGSVLLGVVRAELSSISTQWPESLDERLQLMAASLASALCLELERKKIFDQFNFQSEQIKILLHQLRNPLAAFKTYAQLLLRKLGPESNQRNLVEGLLTEQEQLNKYLLALDDLTDFKENLKSVNSSRLLLPPFLTNKNSIDLKALLEPLIERANATASLQGREWFEPSYWPDWIDNPRPSFEAVIPEIIANLLENAFRYSRPNASIGLSLNDQGICVWDNGIQIPIEEREKIFKRGYRSKKNRESIGSGLGLTLGRQLAEQIGWQLNLSTNPSSFERSLPSKGNAFVINWQVALLP